ncbi:MAG: hypothetical protein CMH18_05380 [Methylophaga sp.]|nr:hypothetical protein [Methylophaga sp.]
MTIGRDMAKKTQKINSVKFPPASLIQLFSADEWESFIEDCCRVDMGEGKKYQFVQKMGGAGDGGRDIEARYSKELKVNEWDLYQAKHYQSAIGESVLYPELEKIMYHIGSGTYPSPHTYYVCASQNTTPKLHDLIAHPHELKETFLTSWKDKKHGIDTTKFPLAGPTLNAAINFDYSKVEEYPVKDLISLHSKNLQAHAALFGLEPLRGDNPPTPILPSEEELVYINQLIKVYSEHANSDLLLEHIFKSEIYKEHLEGCRGEFYSAEGLKRFSRDVLPGEFDRLLVSVLAGIKRIAASPKHKNGMDKLETVLSAAAELQITNNPLSTRLLPADLPGACHQLVNDEKLKWLK